MTKEERIKIMTKEAEETGLARTLYKLGKVSSELSSAADDLALIYEDRSKLNKQLCTGKVFNKYYRLRMLMDEVLYLHNIKSWDAIDHQADNVYEVINRQFGGILDDNT